LRGALAAHFGEDKPVEIKKCEFDHPAREKSSTGLYPGIFSEDVGFRFQVNVKVTDPKDVEEMLELFNRAAADFNDTWKRAMN
jgi:hypothetical protein